MTGIDFYTSKQVAEMLGVTVMTLCNWRRKGIGPLFIRFGPRSIRYRKSRMHAFIEAKENGKRFDRRQGHPSIASKMSAECDANPPSSRYGYQNI